MDARSIPRPPVSLADWESLPEDHHFRFEVAEGVMAVWPPLGDRHQRGVQWVAGVMERQLSRGARTLRGVEILLEEEPLTIRIPDVVVVPTAAVACAPRRYTADDVRLAVEVSVDGSRRIDRVLKSVEYAAAGIARYWIIDIAATTTLSAYGLVDGGYELVAETTGGVGLEVAGHPVHLDLAALTRR